MTPLEAMNHDWITGVNDPPQPIVRSSVSSRASLNASPSAPSSRGSRLSGLSTGSSVNNNSNPNTNTFKRTAASTEINMTNQVVTANKTASNRSKVTPIEQTKRTSLNAAPTMAPAPVPKPIQFKPVPVIEKTLTKENDGGQSQPRRSSSASKKSSKSPSALAASTFKNAANFVVKTIKGRRSSTSTSKTPVGKTPSDKSSSDSKSTTISKSDTTSSTESMFYSPTSPTIKLPTVVNQPYAASQATVVSQPSIVAQQTVISQPPSAMSKRSSTSSSIAGQLHNSQYYSNIIPLTPNYSPSTSSASKRTTMLQNIPITITGGGIVNIHNPNGTTTTFMPGQQLPPVNMYPMGYSPTGTLIKSTGSPSSVNNRISGYYANPTNTSSPSHIASEPHSTTSTMSREDPSLNSSTRRQSYVGGDAGNESSEVSVSRGNSDSKKHGLMSMGRRNQPVNTARRISGWFSG
ncbi:hypothetical protein HK096_009667 [Nowakowskiella sp. JEL0078]|nr:hypothetical protein HK096_009667 [Nowakowskiella sp. JEL0078]